VTGGISRGRARLGRLFGALAVWALSACSSTSVPGNVQLGTFGFAAQLVDGGTLPHFSASGADAGVVLVVTPDGGFNGFSFVATLSLDRPKPAGAVLYPAWVTQGAVSRDAGFDGQYLTSTAEAPRAFPACACGEGINVIETLTLAVLSPAQASGLDGKCPPNVLDGGLPPGPPLDLSIEVSAIESPLVCGALVDELSPQPGVGCLCGPGFAVFEVTGVRQ
jgi:hypothetical protein